MMDWGAHNAIAMNWVNNELVGSQLGDAVPVPMDDG
jgi:hypothetical protein